VKSGLESGEKAKEWQNRPLEKIYPVVFMDGIVVKTRKDGMVWIKLRQDR